MSDDRMQFRPPAGKEQASGPQSAEPAETVPLNPPPPPPEVRNFSSDVIVKAILITFILVLVAAIVIVALKKSGVFEPKVPQLADTANPKTLDAAHWTLQYPGNWQVVAEEGVDQNRYVMIRSPQGAYLKLEMVDSDKGVGPQLSAKVTEYDKTGKDFRRPGEQRPFFSKWAGLEGRGSIFHLTVENVDYEGRVFAYYLGDGQTFFAHRIVAIELAPRLRSGFELIESTFTLKDDPNQTGSDDTPEDP
ncbi:MAG: hypothetical protein R3236_01810 [Phycisphaeraceae bacterium]|nr:hypothetical protein [Phycisphaeraceae bacterium]